LSAARLQTALPALLAPWQSWLALLSLDVASFLARSAGLLEPLLGGVTPKFSSAETVLEGLGGLDRRGDYARLSMSEWLLADAFPDEFLRRALMHEHLFLAPEIRPVRAQKRWQCLIAARSSSARHVWRICVCG
jgi:hypothetical protein